jgi:hypothetical protein
MGICLLIKREVTKLYTRLKRSADSRNNKKKGLTRTKRLNKIV